MTPPRKKEGNEMSITQEYMEAVDSNEQELLGVVMQYMQSHETWDEERDSLIQ